jgi:hypothetical protein
MFWKKSYPRSVQRNVFRTDYVRRRKWMHPIDVQLKHEHPNDRKPKAVCVIRNVTEYRDNFYLFIWMVLIFILPVLILNSYYNYKTNNWNRRHLRIIERRHYLERFETFIIGSDGRFRLAAIFTRSSAVCPGFERDESRQRSHISSRSVLKFSSQ